MENLPSKRYAGVSIEGSSHGGLSIQNVEKTLIFRSNPSDNKTYIKDLIYNNLYQEKLSTENSIMSDNFFLEHVNDRTKRFTFDLSLITPGVTRTFIVPDSNITIGSVSGPVTSTINALTRWDNNGGTLLKDSLNVTMDDHGTLTFTEGTTATKGIVFPNTLNDSFHFKNVISGKLLLVFNTVSDIPQFPNSLELNNATDNCIVFPDNKNIGLQLKTNESTYMQFKSTDNEEEVHFLKDSVFFHGIKFAVDTIAVNITLDSSHFLVRGDTSGGNITIHLPPTSEHTGRQYKFIKVVEANTLSIDPYLSESINGISVTLILTGQNDHITLVCDGTSGWFTF